MERGRRQLDGRSGYRVQRQQGAATRHSQGRGSGTTTHRSELAATADGQRTIGQRDQAAGRNLSSTGNFHRRGNGRCARSAAVRATAKQQRIRLQRTELAVEQSDPTSHDITRCAGNPQTVRSHCNGGAATSTGGRSTNDTANIQRGAHQQADRAGVPWQASARQGVDGREEGVGAGNIIVGQSGHGSRAANGKATGERIPYGGAGNRAVARHYRRAIYQRTGTTHTQTGEASDWRYQHGARHQRIARGQQRVFTSRQPHRCVEPNAVARLQRGTARFTRVDRCERQR